MTTLLVAAPPVEKKKTVFKNPITSLFRGEIFFQNDSAIEAFMSETTFTPDPKQVKRYNPQKSLWIPYAETLGANLLLGSYNGLIMDEEFAQIDFDTIKTNFERGWHWDTDGLYTNMFLHPFQGAIYFNTARSSGYGYAASFLVTLFGSLQWEYIMENQPPSINDLVMTTFAGALFGEMFYRISSLLLDDADTGGSRVVRELLWTPMNIPRGVNRLLYGYSYRTLPHQLYKREPYIIDISLGINNVANGTNFDNGSKYTFSRIQFVYGNIFRKKCYDPMDFFSFIAESQHGLSFSLGDRLRRLQIDGVIYGKQYQWGEKHRMILGFHQYADYLNTNIYKIGGYTIGGGVFYSYLGSSKNFFAVNFKAGWTPMGAANSDYALEHSVEYFEEDPGRSYNVGTGISTRLQVTWAICDWIFSVQHYFWWVHTLDGAKGDEIIQMVLPSVHYTFYKRFYLNIQYLFYHRHGFYDEYNNINLRNNEQRINVGFRF